MCRDNSSTFTVPLNNASNKQMDELNRDPSCTKKLRFADEKKISVIEHMHYLDEQNVKNLWYNEKDYRKFRIDSHIISSSVRQNGNSLDKYLLKAYRAVEKGNAESCVTSLMKWVASLDPNITCRGFENMCNYEFSDKINRDHRKTIKTVLAYAQHKNLNNEKNIDSEMLRNISEKESQKSKDFALAIATVDSIEVNGKLRPKSISFVKRLSNVMRAKKAVIPV